MLQRQLGGVEVHPAAVTNDPLAAVAWMTVVKGQLCCPCRQF